MTKKIPHAKGLPVVGLLPKFLKDPRSYIQEVSSHGDIVNVTLGGMKVTYIFHPQYVQHVLLKNHQNYVKGKLMERTKLVFGEGLLTREGESWKRQRRNMAASFTPDMIEEFSDIVCDISHSFIDQMKGVRNVDSDCLALTLEIVLQSLFGASSASHVDVISKSFDVISDFFASSSEFFIQFPMWVPTSRNRKFKSAFSEMDQVVSQIIQNRKGNEIRRDLLQRILDNSSDETERIIRDEVRTLMLAGHETTSLSIVFSLWLLAEHPEMQDKVRQQVLQITGKDRVQPKHRRKLTAIENIIREAIRIYPPAPIFVREPLEDDILGDYHVPAGSIVIIPPFQIHHDERWYENAAIFDPSRWNNEMTENLPKMAYLPFGGGPRICIGRHMAMMESILILAEIIRCYRIEKTSSSQLNLVPSITLRPKGGVYLEFTPL